MKILYWIILIPAMAGIVLFQNYFDNAGYENQEKQFYFVADGEFIKPLFLGYHDMISDIYWIKTVLYMGRNIDEKDYPYTATLPFMKRDVENRERFDNTIANEYIYLHEMIEMVTGLDPYFKFPYLLGGLFIPLKTGYSDTALKILEKGGRYYPDEWRIPFLKGFNYFFYKGDSKNALKNFILASRYENCPPDAAKLARVILKYYGKKEAVVKFLESFKGQTRNSEVKEEIDKYLKELKN